MPQITDPPPESIAEELAELELALDEAIPAKALDRNLLIATWNIRAFGNLTKKWEADEDDSPKRDFHALHSITRIVSRFDVIAVQEVRGNLRALRYMMALLQPHWSFILSDVTRGAPGNGERLAFLFDTRRVNLSGLACELVVPKEELDRISPDALHEQFARTPYAVSFLAGDKTFILVTLHVLYGEEPEDRLPELKAIADWLADWAQEINTWGHNLIALGDFNIDRRGDELYEAFTSTGLTVPDDLHAIPRTIFSDPEAPTFYDQIAWFAEEDGDRPALSLDYVKGGSFAFQKHTLKSLDLTDFQLSWRISDHYPLWAEFWMRE
jgi:endonuclease/exonuclease/phosphatase family metal-dependent hydrolase